MQATAQDTSPWNSPLWLAAILALFAVVLWRFHFGYLALIDQDLAIRGAIGWQQHFPFLGTTHWELRHPFVWALSAGLALFGKSEWSLLAPVMAAGFATASLFYFALRRLCGPRVALLASLILVTVPQYVYSSSTLMPGIFEALFWAAGLYFYAGYLRGRHVTRNLILTGLSFGFVFLVRETAAQVVLALAIFYFIAVRRDFGRHWLLVGGFVLIALFDLSFGYVRHGDPFYRYVIDVQQYHPREHWKATPIFEPTFANAEAEVQAAYNPDKQRKWVAGTEKQSVGPMSVNKSFDLYLLFFLNHEYGGLFFGLVAAAVAAAASRSRLAPNWRGATLFLCLLVSSLLVLNYGLGVRPHPRYYLVLITAVAGLLAIMLDAMIRAERGWLAGILLALTLLGNAMGLDLRTPRMVGERILAANPWGLDEPIYVQPVTMSSARFFIELADNPPELRAGPPPPGGHFLYVSDSTLEVSERSDFTPGADWQEVWRNPDDERWAGQILRLTGLQSVLPESLFRKLLLPDSQVVLYRRPVASAD